MVRKLSENNWEIPIGHIPNMRVPGRLFVSENLLDGIEPGTIDQIANVATLPGIRNIPWQCLTPILDMVLPLGE